MIKKASILWAFILPNSQETGFLLCNPWGFFKAFIPQLLFACLYLNPIHPFSRSVSVSLSLGVWKTSDDSAGSSPRSYLKVWNRYSISCSPELHGWWTLVALPNCQECPPRSKIKRSIGKLSVVSSSNQRDFLSDRDLLFSCRIC